MKQFKFLGNPADYRWDFPLVPERTYNGNQQAYRRHSIQETLEIAKIQKDRKFLAEWEEVTPI